MRGLENTLEQMLNILLGTLNTDKASLSWIGGWGEGGQGKRERLPGQKGKGKAGRPFFASRNSGRCLDASALACYIDSGAHGPPELSRGPELCKTYSKTCFTFVRMYSLTPSLKYSMYYFRLPKPPRLRLLTRLRVVKGFLNFPIKAGGTSLNRPAMEAFNHP